MTGLKKHPHPLEYRQVSRTAREMRQEIAAAVREMRHVRDWTQEEMARASGVSASAIARIEQMRVSPSIDTLIKLGDAVPVDIGFRVLWPELVLTGIPVSPNGEGREGEE